MTAREKYESWLDVPEEDLRAELEAMTDEDIEECFACDM